MMLWTHYTPKRYRAESTVMTMVSQGKGAGFYGLAAQLGGLMDFGGPGGGGDIGKLLAILNSRSLAEIVVQSENLLPRLFPDQWDAVSEKWKDEQHQPSLLAGASQLSGKMKFEEGHGLITVSGIFQDPVLAARVVNTYVEKLQSFVHANAFTLAKRNRIFIETQMKQKKQEMLEAGKEIAGFYKEGGRVSLREAKVDAPVDAASATMYPSSSRGFLPAVTGNLWKQLQDLQENIEDIKSVKDVPQQVYLTYLTRRYALLGSVYEFLVTQYEHAKIDEAKSDLAFQVVDPAIVPGGTYGQNWKLNITLTSMASLFVGIFYAFLYDYVKRVKSAALAITKPAAVHSNLEPIFKTTR